MVLRKPYAFFIKHFRLFHIILAGLVVYSIFRATGVVNFINEYSQNATAIDNLITVEQVSSVYSTFDFVIIVLTFIMSSILLVVMTMKQKKNKFYAYSTTMAAIFFVLNIYGRSTLLQLTKVWLTDVTLNVVSNLYIFAIVALIVQAAVAISRAVGFNISRFDFNNDILKLQADESDNEEIEFVVDFDVNDLKRGIQKNSRYVKYFLKENSKTLLWCLGVFGSIALLYFGFSVYSNRKNVVSVEKLKNVPINGFKIQYNDSYIVNTDSLGNELEDNKTLLVLDLTITNASTKSQAFNLSGVNINIGNNNYTATLKYQNQLKDLGTLYNMEEITGKRNDTNKNEIVSSSRNLYVYEIQKNQLGNKIYLNVLPLNEQKSYYLELTPKNLIINDIKEVNAELNNEIVFQGNTFSDSKLVINDIEIAEEFKLNYKYGNLLSSEYIPSSVVKTNKEMAVMKLVGTFETNNDLIPNLYSLVNNYAYIEYKKDNKTYKQKNGFLELKPLHVKEKNTTYITILDEIRNSDSASLVFNIRGTKYIYNLDSALNRNGGN